MERAVEALRCAGELGVDAANPTLTEDFDALRGEPAFRALVE